MGPARAGEEEHMFARVVARTWKPDQSEEGIRLFRELSLGALQVLPGFRGAYLLVDREKGRGEGISFWDTEAHARDANAAVKDVRAQVSQELGVEPEITYYEAVAHAPETRRPGAGTLARVTTLLGRPELVDERIRHHRQEVYPAISRYPGFRGSDLLVQRAEGKAMAITLWDSPEAERASAEAVVPLREAAGRGMGVTQAPAVELYELAVLV
jgi:heme-degrading monooxygenase HmoA